MSHTSETAIVELLSAAGAFDEPGEVECIETYISWVFLTEQHAYKLKKRVQFEYLDFRSTSDRFTACCHELQLNRRLAPDVYLGLVPVVDAGHSCELGEIIHNPPPHDAHLDELMDHADTTVDWLVKMRRLNESDSVDARLRDTGLSPTDLSDLTGVLERFYRSCSPVAIDEQEYLREVDDHVRHNREELLQPTHQLDSEVVRRIHEFQLRLLSLYPEQFRQRVTARRVVDGHGDLRPEHIYLTNPQPVIIDCVEFNAEFRQVDVLDELSFLAMECAALDSQILGEEILEQFCHRAGDRVDAALLQFYRSYRACVRAKVFALRAEQQSGDDEQSTRRQAVRYLQLAEQSVPRFATPLLIVVRGLSGTGKSTVAEDIATQLGIEHLSTDAIRRANSDQQDLSSEINQQRYSPSQRNAVYQEMMTATRDSLSKGLSVVLDGTFLEAEQRLAAVDLAAATGSRLQFVHCECPDDVAKERITLRQSEIDNESDATPEIHDWQRQRQEPDEADWPVMTLDTTQDRETNLQQLLVRLRLKLHAPH